MVCMLYTYMILVWYAHIICDVFVSSSFLRFLVSFSVVSLFPLCFLVSSFLGFLVSSFLRFFVSSFLRFFVSSFLRFFVSSCPLAGSRSQVGGAVSLCFLMVLEYFFLILLIIFFDPLNIFFDPLNIFFDTHPVKNPVFLETSIHCWPGVFWGLHFTTLHFRGVKVILILHSEITQEGVRAHNFTSVSSFSLFCLLISILV